MVDLIDAIQTAAIVATILFGAYQLMVYVRSLRAAAHTDAIGQYLQLVSLPIANPDLISNVDKPFSPADVNEPKALAAGLFFTFFEGIHAQRRKYRFIDEEVWNGWARYLAGVLAMTYYRTHWEATREGYPESFRQYVDSLIVRTA